MDENSGCVVTLFTILLMAVFLTGVVANIVGKWEVQREAVKLGKGEWSFDEEGWSRFQWKSADDK